MIADRTGRTAREGSTDSLDLQLSAAPVTALIVPADRVVRLHAHKHWHMAVLLRRLRELDLSLEGLVRRHFCREKGNKGDSLMCVVRWSGVGGWKIT